MPVSLTKRTGRATLAAMAVPAAVPSTGLHAGLRADHTRLVGRLEELAAVGDTGDGGCCRLALTDEDRRGRDLVVAWMEDLDLDRLRRRHRQRRRALGRGRRRPGDDRLAHRHRPHRGPVRRQLRSPGRARGGRDAQAGEGRARTAPGGRLLHGRGGVPLRPGHAGIAGVRGGHGPRGGPRRTGHRRQPARRRAGAHRVRRSAALPEPHPARLRGAPHRAGPGAGGRGDHDRGRHRRAGHLVAGADHHRPVQPRRHHAHGPSPRPRLRGRRTDRRGPPARARARRPSGRHRGPLPGAPGPGQRRPGVGHAVSRPAQHRRVGAAGCRAAPGRASRGVGRRRGGHRLRPEPGPLRAGRVRRQGGRPGRGDRATARPLRAPHALGGRPRRPDAGPGVPDRHGLRAEREGHQPQPRRAHTIRSSSARASTCCCTYCSTWPVARWARS